MFDYGGWNKGRFWVIAGLTCLVEACTPPSAIPSGNVWLVLCPAWLNFPDDKGFL